MADDVVDAAVVAESTGAGGVDRDLTGCLREGGVLLLLPPRNPRLFSAAGLDRPIPKVFDGTGAMI